MRSFCVAVALLLPFGCLQSSSIQCGDRTCPATFTCTPSGDSCVPGDALEACIGVAAGDSCTASGLSGICKDAVCEVIICGNDRVDPTEVCDDGNITAGDGCNSTCRSDETCGNGFIDVGEGCDCGDGPDRMNAICDRPNSSDASATCRPDCTPHACGDGVVETPEQCEQGIITDTCAKFGYYEGTLGCDASCQYEVTSCAKRCGDGVVNNAVEYCDMTPPPGSCIDFGYNAGPLECSPFCTPRFASCREIGWREFAPDERSFTSVWGSSDSDVWGGGTDSGDLLRWNGATWTPSFIGIQEEVAGIWGTSATNVYAVANTKVMHYNGMAWSEVATASNSLHGISGSAPDHIIAVGDAGTILTWDGANWTSATSNLGGDLLSVQVVSPTQAFAVGEFGAVLRMTGTTWSAMPAPTSSSLRTVWGSSANDLYVGGDRLMHWNGTVWSVLSFGDDSSVLAIAGTSPNDVFVTLYTASGVLSLRGPVYHFDGASWSLHDTGISSEIMGLWAGNGRAFAAGLRMSRYTGSSWALPRPVDPARIAAIGGGPTGPILAVGYNGLRMAYDGAFWRTVTGDVSRNLRAVSRSVAVGDGGAIATFDGTRLTARPSGTTNLLLGVWGASDTDLWAVGVTGTIVRFDGTSGSVVPSGTNAILRGVFGFAADDVFIVGDSGTMLHWNGTSWDPFASGTGADLYGVWGTSASDLWVVGAGVVRYWNGSTWADRLPALTLGGPTFSAVFGASTNDVYVVDARNTKLLRWSGIWFNVPLGDQVTAVGGRGTEVFAGGENLSMFRRTGPGAFAAELPNFQGNQPVTAMHAAGPDDVYAIFGVDLVHYDGMLWSRVTQPQTGITRLGGTGPNDVFVLTNGDRIGHWDGTSWTIQNPLLPLFTGLFDLDGSSPADIWAVGQAGVIRRYTGSWSSVTSPVATNLNGVYVASPTAAFAVGDAGVIVRWDGSNWTTMTSPVTGRLSAVWGTSDTNIFAVGAAGTVLHCDGTTWATMTSNTTANLSDVFGGSATDVFAVGSAGTIVHYDGERWSPVESRTTSAINGVAVVGKSTFFASSLPYPILRLQRDVAW